MAKPFRFRYVNQIAGAFAALILIILISGFVVAAHAQKWFEGVTKITVNMPAQGFYGIKEGAEILMLGTTVGAVDQIHIDENTGQMTARSHIKTDFVKFIRTGADGSTIIIRIPLALKDPYLEIVAGTGGKPLDAKRNETIQLQAVPEVGAGDTLNETLLDVRNNTLPKVNAIIGKFQQNDNILGRLLNDKKMADDITTAIAKLTASADNIQTMLANLKQTTDELPGIAHSASAQVNMLPPMIDQTSQMLGEVKKTLHDLQQTTEQLPPIMSSLKATIDQLPDVLLHVQQTLIEVQKLVKGLQGLPFVRDSVPQAQSAQHLRPSDIGAAP